MEEIRQWLKSPPDYDAGTALYMKYGKDKLLRRVFNEPESDFKKKKLVESLRELLIPPSKKILEPRTEIETLIKEPRTDYGWPEKRDPTEEALWLRWKPLFAEMMNLSSRIYDVALAGGMDTAMKMEAGRMAHRILDLDDQCEDIYGQRDFYIKHKRLPEEKKPMELVVDSKKVPLALLNAKRYVRDYKVKLKKNAADIFAAEQLKKWEWAVSEYERILNLE